jgi:serine/threonine protein kinase
VNNFVSKLKLGKQLGKGHFGDVFLGDDPVHGEVAVKVMSRKAGEADADWIKRKDGLLAEAQNLKKATHPNVVQVYHCAQRDDGESIQLSMDFCEGGSLQAAFDESPMRLSAVRKAGTEVSLGLQSLHHRGMLHRDIKPGNILVSGNGVARLGDFGLVTDDLVVGYGSAAGYSDHIAVEVWQTYTTSAKSDIWALGMTIYRLLHGKVWYGEAPNPAALVKKGGFAATLKFLPHVPQRWRRAIRKMMHDDSSVRYQSVDQVLAAFSKLPVDQDWDCDVTGAKVCWQRIAKGRKIIVEWDRHSARKHEWRAWSEPLGSGRKHTLGGSTGIVGSAQATKELEEFFES